MSAWSVSPILQPLIMDVRREHPGIVIGTIGDPAHQAEESDHNPDDWDYVCAADFMIGPHFTMADADRLFQRLHALRDPRTAFVIFNRRIFSRTVAAWTVRPYTGSDPHTGHLHASVIHGPNPRPTTSWNVYPKPVEESMPTPTADEIADRVVAKLSAAVPGSSGPNWAQDVERTEAIERQVTEVNSKLDQVLERLSPPTAEPTVG